MNNSNLISDAAQEPLADMHIQTCFYIFTANAFFCLGVILVGMLPYYHYFGPEISLMGFVICISASIPCYVAMAFTLSIGRTHAAIGLACVWWLCIAGVVGFMSAVLYNIVPLQFMLVSMMQSLAIVCFSRQSPYWMPWGSAALVMLSVTVLVWCASIYAFVIEADWGYAGGMASAAILLIAYNARQIHRSKERKGASWDAIAESVLGYYCFDVLHWMEKMQ